MVLFVPEAIPELCSGTEAITAAVKGATTIPIPVPKIIIPGKYVDQYSFGPSVKPGIVKISSPIPAKNGPTINGILAPNLSEKIPENRESPARITANGRNVKPAISSE
jgi:hypothetical protein